MPVTTRSPTVLIVAAGLATPTKESARKYIPASPEIFSKHHLLSSILVGRRVSEVMQVVVSSQARVVHLVLVDALVRRYMPASMIVAFRHRYC